MIFPLSMSQYVVCGNKTALCETVTLLYKEKPHYVRHYYSIQNPHYVNQHYARLYKSGFIVSRIVRIHIVWIFIL